MGFHEGLDPGVVGVELVDFGVAADAHIGGEGGSGGIGGTPYQSILL